jgi:hypothetical protein
VILVTIQIRARGVMSGKGQSGRVTIRKDACWMGVCGFASPVERQALATSGWRASGLDLAATALVVVTNCASMADGSAHDAWTVQLWVTTLALWTEPGRHTTRS